MLQKLSVSNYTVMAQVDVAFQPGLNVITGETGVGKSLLLEAVNSLLGARRTGLPVRHGSRKAIIEAEFDPADKPALETWLEERDLPADFPLIIRREFHTNGKTRYFINDTPASLDIARGLGDRLLDLHGQHEVVTLFNRARQLQLLDAYLCQPDLLKRYRDCYTSLQEYRRRLTDLRAKIEDAANGREALLRQQRELEALNPQLDEMAFIERQLELLENSEKIYRICTDICNLLNESPKSAVEQITTVIRTLPDLYPYNPSLRSWEDELGNFRSVLLELNRTLLEFSRDAQHDPKRVEELRQRHAALTGFLKRWSYTDQLIEDVAAAISRGLAEINALNDEATRLVETISSDEEKLLNLGKKISRHRQTAAKKLEEQVHRRLSLIGMKGAKFRVAFAPISDDHVYPDGLDRIDYQLSPNDKIGFQSLNKVASGGEMSRIMLALKSSLADADSTETLIFDEIDQGISGRIAHKVGMQLYTLARSHQVVVVTHLPQIASFADLHLSVRKNGSDGYARVHELSSEEQIEELASLLTASGVTESARLNAREMVTAAIELKNQLPNN